MFVDLEPIVKSRITNPSVLVLEASLEIHLNPAENLQNKIFVHLILVVLEQDANQELTVDLEVTDLSVLVHLAIEGTHCSLVPEVNVKMIVNAPLHRLASILSVRTLVEMLVALVLSAKLSIMVLFALVPMDTLEIP